MNLGESGIREHSSHLFALNEKMKAALACKSAFVFVFESHPEKVLS